MGLDSRVRYFSFGSNMLRSVLEGRRGIVPLARTPAVCADHRLAFTALGIPPFEPAFASLEPAAGRSCHGVLYTLALPDWLRLCASEGVPFAYRTIPVQVRAYAAGMAPENASEFISAMSLRSFQPQTLLSLPPLELRPSKRYLGLIKAGAAESGLTQAWQKELAAQRPA